MFFLFFIFYFFISPKSKNKKKNKKGTHFSLGHQEPFSEGVFQRENP